MTLPGKSMAIVLTGVLVIAIAVALPLPLVFGEGGARRDVVRHELERNATLMDMLYLVEFEATQAGAPTSREQTIERLDTLVIPTLGVWGRMARSVLEALSPVLSPGPLWLEPSRKMR